MSKTTWVIVAAVVVIALVAVLAIGSSGGGGGGETVTPDVRYNYETEFCDGFVTKTGDISRPAKGMQYVVLTVKACNDKLNSITTNAEVWKWEFLFLALEYKPCAAMYSHPMYKLTDIMKGSEETFAYVYEIPSYLEADDLKVRQIYLDGRYDFRSDESIVV